MTLDLVLLGLAIALDPVPMAAYILLLGSRGGSAKGLGFIVGWLLCLVLVVVLTLLLTGGRPLKTNSTPSTFALVLRIVAGLVLLGLAWRKRGNTGRRRSKPRWQSNLDGLGIAAAIGIAALLQPWLLVGSGAATVAQADLSERSGVLSIVAFGLLASLTYFIVQTCAVFNPAATTSKLNGLQFWIDEHRERTLIVLYTVIGLWLIGKSTYLLV